MKKYEWEIEIRWHKFPCKVVNWERFIDWKTIDEFMDWAEKNCPDVNEQCAWLWWRILWLNDKQIDTIKNLARWN